MKILNVAIIGYGLSGRIFHGAILNGLQGYSVSKVVTHSPEKAKLALDELPDVEISDSADKVFSDPSIDVVVICSPNTSHYTLASAALKSGKHVVVEKPFVVTSDEGAQLKRLSEQTGCVLSVYHNRRYDGDFKTIKAILSEGKLGRLVEFESHFDRFRNTFKKNAWREDDLPGSGILFDLGAHLIDQALDLFGMPQSLYADIRKQRDGAVDDNFELIFYYPNLKVTLKSGSLVAAPLPRFILLGTDGAYTKYGLDVQEQALRDGHRPVQDIFWGVETEDMWGTLHLPGDAYKIETLAGDYRAYYEDFYSSVTEGHLPAITAQDGLNVIRLIELAFESSRTGRRIDIDA